MTTTAGSRESAASARARPMDPLRALAQQHRLRCYRDACGDWNIPGRFGELFWYGSAHDGLPDRIGVQIGGPLAKGAPSRTTEHGGNIRINRLIRCWGTPSQRGAGEAVFVLPTDRLLEAIREIGALRKRRGQPMSPEQRAEAAERLRRVRPRSRTTPLVAGFGLTPGVGVEIPAKFWSGARTRPSGAGGRMIVENSGEARSRGSSRRPSSHVALYGAVAFPRGYCRQCQGQGRAACVP